jgi:hypothetical protein
MDPTSLAWTLTLHVLVNGVLRGIMSKYYSSKMMNLLHVFLTLSLIFCGKIHSETVKKRKMNLAAFTVIIEEPLQLSVKFAHQRGT